MKKLLLITLILSLLLAIPACAELPAFQMDWSDDAEQAFINAGFEGTWYTLTMGDVKFDALIPSGFELRSPTEEEAANGAALVFENGEQNSMITVLDTRMEEYGSVAEFGEALKENDPETTVQYGVINGKEAMIHATEDPDKVTIVFDLGGHRFVQIVVIPLTGNNELVPLFMASIQF